MGLVPDPVKNPGKYALTLIAVAYACVVAASTMQAYGPKTYQPIILRGMTQPMGGRILAQGECITSVTVVDGARVGMASIATPLEQPGNGADWKSYVSAPDLVTVKLCAVAVLSPIPTPYSVRVVP